MSWPRSLGSVPSLKDVNLLCWLLLITVAAFAFAARRGPEQLRDADFVQIYSVGRLLNEYPPQELYNYQLQQKISYEVHPLKDGYYGPSPYPPYVAVLFRPFAHMPYLQAYLLWTAITLALYLAGLAMLTAKFFQGPLHRSLIFSLALGFKPFFVGTVLNGQLSAIGFFALALAFREDDRDRPVLSGLALSLCAYKPTLLMLILPMLLVRWRLKTLAAFGVGVLALVLFASVVEGAPVWSGYFSLLRSFTGMHSLLRLTVYLDFRSFAALLSRTHPRLAVAAVATCSVLAAVGLFRVWLRSAGLGKGVNVLVWGTTITWTLLLNIYVPSYDSILLVLSIVMTARVMKNIAGQWFGFLCVLLFAGAWFDVKIAQLTGVQILTVLVTALGALQIYACNQQIKTGLKQRSSADDLANQTAQESSAVPIG